MKVQLRELKQSDVEFFSKWWRDGELISLTSGVDYKISDDEVSEYFEQMIDDEVDWNFMIDVDDTTVGHISLCKRDDDWFETQIVIGEKDYQNKGVGTEAIKQLIEKARKSGIFKIFLEVRPNNSRAIKAYEKCGFVAKNIIEYPDNKFLPSTLKMELEQ